MEVEYFTDSFGELSGGHSSPKTSRSAGKKRRGSRYTAGGLRQFSAIVCSKLKSKGRATYDEYDMKNIRRRVYDALNVLMAMDIITKEKKQIWWKGLRDTNAIDREGIKAQCAKLMGRISAKEAYLKDLEEQLADLQNLMLHNKQLLKSGNSSHKGFSFPFILAQTSNNATVEIEISEDMQLVHCDFNSTPFSLHDDTSILKMLRCRQLPESRNVSQSSSVYSSSSSGMASTRPFLWNSETQTPK